MGHEEGSERGKQAVLGVCAQALAGLCEEQRKLPHAGHGQFQLAPTNRAQMRPWDKVLMPLGKGI